MPGADASSRAITYTVDYKVEKKLRKSALIFPFPRAFSFSRREGRDNVKVSPLDGEREWSILIAP